MKKIISLLFLLFISIAFSSEISAAGNFQCYMTDENDNKITSASPGDTVYLVGVYMKRSSGKVKWEVNANMPSNSPSKYNFKIKNSGYFWHDGSPDYFYVWLPVLIPPFDYIEGTAIFSGKLTSIGNCSGSLNIVKQSSISPLPNPPSNNSTLLITDYMKIKYDQEIINFENDEHIIDRELAAKGLINSGAHIQKFKENIIKHIQYFIDNSFSYISQIEMQKQIDKKAISLLFDLHKNNSITYMQTFTNNHIGAFAENLVQQTKIELGSNIQGMFTVVQLQIEAL
jgi:hypothetical protein